VVHVERPGRGQLHVMRHRHLLRASGHRRAPHGSHRGPRALPAHLLL
jgi:hypothetical protein